MSIHEEKVWRAALERKGREWVRRELQTRPGQPRDDVLDIVYEEPYPTREFCQRWCAEQENRMHLMSVNTIAILATIVVLVSVTTMAVSSIANYRPAQDQYPDARHEQTAGSGSPTNLIEDPAPSVNSPTSSGSASSQVLGLCAYATYQTAACKSP